MAISRDLGAIKRRGTLNRFLNMPGIDKQSPTGYTLLEGTDKMVFRLEYHRFRYYCEGRIKSSTKAADPVSIQVNSIEGTGVGDGR